MARVVAGFALPSPILPLLLTKKNVEEPLVTANEPLFVLTEAVTLPDEIWFKFNPTTPDANINEAVNA